MRENLIVSNVCLSFERWGGLVARAEMIAVKCYIFWREVFVVTLRSLR